MIIIIELNSISNNIIFRNEIISIDKLNSIIWSVYDMTSAINVATIVISIIVILLSFEMFFINIPPHNPTIANDIAFIPRAFPTKKSSNNPNIIPMENPYTCFTYKYSYK